MENFGAWGPLGKSHGARLAALALKHRLPAIMSFSGFADDGGLMAYGPNLLGMFRQSAAVMAKVLEGAHPGEIPIERPMRFEMIINMEDRECARHQNSAIASCAG